MTSWKTTRSGVTTPTDYQCVNCRRIRPREKLALAALPALPFICKQGFVCYLIGLCVRFRDPYYWNKKEHYSRKTEWE